MKRNKRLFCDLMATGMYNARSAVEAVYGDKYEDAQAQGEFLLSDKKVAKRIKDVIESNELLATTGTVWTKSVLVGLVNRASALEDGSYDPNVIRYALDMINKMNGAYEKDNQQKQDVSLTMHF